MLVTGAVVGWLVTAVACDVNWWLVVIWWVVYVVFVVLVGYGFAGGGYVCACVWVVWLDVLVVGVDWFCGVCVSALSFGFCRRCAGGW